MPRDPEPTRTRILDAVAEAYRSGRGVDFEELAALASVSRSTVYRHFASMEAVHDALQQEAVARGVEMIEQHLGPALREEPGTDLITAIGDVLEVAFSDDTTRIVHAFGREPAAAGAIFQHFEEFAVAALQAGQRRGAVGGDVPVQAAAVALFSLVTGLVTAVREGRLSSPDATAITRRLLSSLREVPGGLWDNASREPAN